MKTDPNSLIQNVFKGDGQGHYIGLTKREYFAALAMQGLAGNNNLSEASADSIIEWSVIMADTLVAELNKDGGGPKGAA